MIRDIDVYSAILTGAQQWGRGKGSRALFENRKKFPDFGKEGPDCVHLWVKFFIQNAVLKVKRKNPKMFPCRASLPLYFFNAGIFSTLLFQVLPAYSILFSVIKAYSRILRHC